MEVDPVAAAPTTAAEQPAAVATAPVIDPEPAVTDEATNIPDAVPADADAGPDAAEDAAEADSPPENQADDETSSEQQGQPATVQKNYVDPRVVAKAGPQDGKIADVIINILPPPLLPSTPSLRSTLPSTRPPFCHDDAVRAHSPSRSAGPSAPPSSPVSLSPVKPSMVCGVCPQRPDLPFCNSSESAPRIHIVTKPASCLSSLTSATETAAATVSTRLPPPSSPQPPPRPCPRLSGSS